MHVLDLISQGKTPTKACDEAGITTGTLKRWINSSSELGTLAEEAFQRGYDTLADALLHIQNHEEYGSSDHHIMKVMSDNIKWYISRKNPSQYGDKLLVENRITADRVIIEALSRGKDRVLLGVQAEDVKFEIVNAIEDSVDISEFM